MSAKQFRFGVVVGGTSTESFAACARRAEQLGYSVLLCSDHLDLSGAHFTGFSVVPSLAYAAAVTSTIRLGSSVINHDFHHPAVLAREAASLDVLSGGRFELGLGAGWAEYEYAWAGIRFDEPRIRVSRFKEYVQVVKSLLESEETSYDGQFFEIKAMPGIPRTEQRPRPPIMVGGTGRRMLGIAAREADIVAINLTAVIAGTAERMDERIEWIRAAAGPRLDRLEIQTGVGTVAVEDGNRRDVLARELQRQKEAGREFMTAGLTEDQLLEAPVALVGSVDQIVEDLEKWRERWGVSNVMIAPEVMEQFAPVVERLVGR